MSAVNFHSPLEQGLPVYRATWRTVRGAQLVFERGTVREITEHRFTVELESGGGTETCPTAFPGLWFDTEHEAMADLARRTRTAIERIRRAADRAKARARVLPFPHGKRPRHAGPDIPAAPDGKARVIPFPASR